MGNMAIKLDLNKAYNRVEWDFLAVLLRKLGFNDKWVHLILQCVTTVKFNMFVNGAKRCSFIPGRGLRQGDPRSPYLVLSIQDELSKAIC